MNSVKNDDNIKMENTDDFNILLIKNNKINNISWLDNDYTKKIINLDIFKTFITNQTNFIEILYNSFDINNLDISNVTIKNEIIGEEPYYVYELLYINTENSIYENDDNINELATLLLLNNEKVYLNAIILKSYLPSLNDSMLFVDIVKEDISRILHNRVYTKIVTWDWDNSWKEIEVNNDLNNYAKTFFDDLDYKKYQIDFLKHDINIWYINDNYGEIVCGNLLNKPIEKCIWFTMKSEELRGNITLDEVKKIIKLSLKIDNYLTPNIFNTEKKDKYDRRIIYNKFKILDYVCNQHNI